MSDGVVVEVANGDVEVNFGADGSVSGAATLTTLNRLTKVTATGTIGMSSVSEAAGALTGIASIASVGAAGITVSQAATQDAIAITGRAGGTGSYAITLTPATLAANHTITVPAVTSTMATLAAQTFVGAQQFTSTLSVGGPPQSTFNGSTVTPDVQYNATTLTGSSVVNAYWNNTAGSAPLFFLAKSRGAAVGTHVAVQSGDAIGGMVFEGSDGTDFHRCAAIFAEAAGTVSSNVVPSRLRFYTGSTSGALGDVMRIAPLSTSRGVAIGFAGVDPINTFGSGLLHPLQVMSVTSGTTTPGAAIVMFSSGAQATACPILTLARSKAASVAYTAVASGDPLCRIHAEGADGTDFATAASIRAFADGTVAANQVPGRWEFYTADSSGAETLALTLNSSQQAVFTAGASAAPSVAIGALGTGFYASGTNQIGISTNGAQRGVFVSGGQLVLGHNALQQIGPTQFSAIQLHSTGANASMAFSRWSNDSTGPALYLGKSRGAAVGTYAIVNNGDALGEIRSNGDDGTDVANIGVRILTYVDGTPGANIIPGALAIYTTNASGTSTLAVTVNSSQDMILAGKARLASLTAGTTAGDLHRESNQDAAYHFANGIGGWLDKCIFSQYAAVTHSGAVTSQSLASGTARGTRTLPANFFKQGKVLKYRLCGVYTTDIVPGNATVLIKIGSTTIRTTGSFALDASITDGYWILDGELTCASTGVSGTIIGQVAWIHAQTSPPAESALYEQPMTTTGAVTFDTTASGAFDVEWTADDAGTAITCTCFRLWEVC